MDKISVSRDRPDWNHWIDHEAVYLTLGGLLLFFVLLLAMYEGTHTYRRKKITSSLFESTPYPYGEISVGDRVQYSMIV